MEAHKSGGQVHLGDIAYLTDRVLVNQGRRQKYGTQFHVLDDRRQPRSIHNPGTVDERRAAMGLTPLQEYTEFMNS